MNQPRVAIVILNWNGWDDTVMLIKSLNKIQNPIFRIIAIDNNSKNNEGPRLMELFGPAIDVIINTENLGYAGGNNESIQKITARGYEYVVIINNDVVVEPGFLEPLVTALDSDAQIGLACPVVRDYRSPKKIQSAGGMVHLPTGTVRLLHKIPQNSYVDFAPGSCFLIRANLWKQLNGFDDKFFLYWEETDLAIRARSIGYRCRVISNSTVYHKTASSSHYLSRTYVYHMLRNQLYFMRKHCPRIQRPLYLLFFFFRNVLGYAILSIIRNSPGLKTIPQAIHDGLKNPLN